MLRLADQKTPAMDKLFYYVSQTDRILPKYLGDVQERSARLLSDATINAIDTSTFSAGVSDDDDDSDGSYEDDDDNESGGDDAESVESDDSVLIEEDITVRRTANGLGESFFGLARYLPRRKSWRKDVVISANKQVLETVF